MAKRAAPKLLLLLLTMLMVPVGFWLVRALETPSHHRDWIEAQARLPAVHRDGDRVRIEGVRNFRWWATTDPDPVWETREYDLAGLQRMWFGVSPFGGRWRGPAHAFLSFEFADSAFLSVSVEARREKGEEYGIVAGLLNRFEVIYLFGDERDVVGLRTHVWQDPVHLYPVSAPPERVREVFIAMLDRAEEIRTRPEFYNTFLHNCTSALLQAANRAREEPIPFGIDVILPGYADRRLLELGLLETELELDAARAEFLLNPRAREIDIGDPHFSARIRERAGS
jgi:hypothetical protein